MPTLLLATIIGIIAGAYAEYRFGIFARLDVRLCHLFFK
jgi:hypothetical protein